MKRSNSTSSNSSNVSTSKTKPIKKIKKEKEEYNPNNSKLPSFDNIKVNSNWTNEKKLKCLEIIWDIGYKNMNWDLLCKETNLTEKQLKNQLSNGRVNLRKTVLEMFK
ncbi:uncharacterized protein I206_100347 [Kwoniella pini CBS 10737]|uniref:Myb-like domain-containing protein n=1 Tax=Kwoniella pini CBS 10737 TaxID=1296096 RepID=A0A1B9IDP8_9TREE|nr:uncharacterized protein I206_00978 [Kwoniella pini CBS 10737]OCF53672.1 hypothetical protein I206_00978 [Kwoniella pini CBS 10737]